jgi:hypothetical protein
LREFPQEGDDDAEMGSRVSFSLLVDSVKLIPGGDDMEVQDEIWSMSFFIRETPNLIVEGVVATRLNKEHVWGRAGNHNYVSYRSDRRNTSGTTTATTTIATSGSSSVIVGTGINHVGRSTISGRGFYDRKRARMDINIVPEEKGHPCSCYTLVLSDFEERYQDDTLIMSWSEPYSAISKSNVVSLLFEPIAVGDRRSKLAPAPILPIATIKANVPVFSVGFREKMTHKTALTVHRIPGPFSRANPSLVLGSTTRTDFSFDDPHRSVRSRSVKVTGGPESQADEEDDDDEDDYGAGTVYPCTMIHRSRYRNRYRDDSGESTAVVISETGSSSPSSSSSSSTRNLPRRLDSISSFDTWMPSNSLTESEGRHRLRR